MQEYTFDYSIIVCVYNPEERILSRCLQAVANLNQDGVAVEVILADNNSDAVVEQQAYVQTYTNRLTAFTSLRVSRQGVKYARMAAIEAARGEYILFIDSDNEPQADYLQELKKLNVDFPQVGVWGPGNVRVDFIDGIDSAIKDYATIAFQERHDLEIMYDTSREWQHCYPFGTGMCTKTFLLKEYFGLAKAGRFTLEGRSGTKLTSGEDTQMVLLSISKGYAAGVSPTLKMTHIIPGSRASSEYLKKLAYGTSLCYGTCVLQVFPEQRANLETELLSPRKFSKEVIKRYWRLRKASAPEKTFELINFIGHQAGKLLALGRPVPFFVRQILRLLKVE